MINAIIYTLLNGFAFNIVLPIWAVLISLGLG
nr:MAG TPA: hypothetical protein [Caudoviricetes sp.]